MPVPATPMPLAHGAHPPLLPPPATSSLTPDTSHPPSSHAPNFPPLKNSFTEPEKIYIKLFQT